MLYNNIYTVDWGRLVKWLLPPVLRRPKMIALLTALVSPVNDLHTRFGYYRSNTLYRLGITPQVVHLERALNDRYDVVERGIYITDGVEMNPIPLFLKIENKPVVLHKKTEGIEQVLFTKSETAVFGTDFVVNVPVTVLFDIAEMTAFVNTYKLAGKTFKIKIV